MNINISLGNTRNTRDAIKAIDKFNSELPEKCLELCDKLAEIGMSAAKIGYTSRFGQTVYGYLFPQEQFVDASVPIYMSVRGKINGTSVECILTASGDNLLFIEFGAGVYFNSGGYMWGERPPGVSNIGEYGKGHGKQQKWYYTNDEGKSQATRGTPEQPGMYIASQEMRRKIEQVVKEVFGE